MKLLTTLCLLSISCSVLAQGTQLSPTSAANLDVTNINAKSLNGGDFFWNLSTPGFEVPRGSGKHTIFAGALWIGGKDQQNTLYVASQTYRQSSLTGGYQAGYWPGPIATVQDQAHSTKYDKIWKVSKTQIQNHIANYNKTGYTAPTDIATWPGNGNTANGEAAKLAPFIDKNNDGIYSPAQGDYPDIKGDQALYLILNDKGNVKTPSSPSMNAEIHVMHYGYDNPGNVPVFNTIFSEFRVINRGQINLHDFYAGLWMDFDIGFYNDDFVGCDTLTNRFFGYNGDNFDETTNGYGSNPPAQSVIFLDKKMSHFVYFNNDNNPTNGNPSQASDYYNYMRSIWKDGKKVMYGGDGTNQNNQPIAYMYPGNPASLNGWSENNTNGTGGTNTPSDRRGLGSIGPLNLSAGQELKFTVAYNYSRGTSNLNSVTQSHLDAQAVQNFFDNAVVSSTKPERVKETLKLYPNPASDQLTIQLPSSFENKTTAISITDNVGRIVLETTSAHQDGSQLHLNIASLNKGVYQVSVISGEERITSRLVKL